MFSAYCFLTSFCSLVINVASSNISPVFASIYDPIKIPPQ
nr:MAG TPA: hypothetical protein [Caudoviricetes sp.]